MPGLLGITVLCLMGFAYTAVADPCGEVTGIAVLKTPRTYDDAKQACKNRGWHILGCPGAPEHVKFVQDLLIAYSVGEAWFGLETDEKGDAWTCPRNQAYPEHILSYPENQVNPGGKVDMRVSIRSSGGHMSSKFDGSMNIGHKTESFPVLCDAGWKTGTPTIATSTCDLGGNDGAIPSGVPTMPTSDHSTGAMHPRHYCGHGTMYNDDEGYCVPSFQNFVDQCKHEPHQPMCGHHQNDCGSDPIENENCYRVLLRKNLQCPANTMPRSEGDWHKPFGDNWDGHSVDDITRECCQGPPCNEWPGTCPDGKMKVEWHRPTTLDEKECCFHNCHTIMERDSLTCPTGKTARTKHDFHMPWGTDWASHTVDDITRECCPETCHTVMMSKNLTCEVGEPRRHDDMHMPFGHDWNRPDDEIKKGCCRQNCHSVMHSKNLHCAGESKLRSSDDWHMPFGDDWERSDHDLKEHCCRRSCRSVLQSKNIQCSANKEPRDEDDYHDPFGGLWEKHTHVEIQRECCRSSISCGEAGFTCSDGKVLAIWHKPETLSKEQCCHHNCHSETQRRGLTCPSNTKQRHEQDFFMPFGGADWKSRSDEEVTEKCCLQTCHIAMNSRDLHCDAPLEVRNEEDRHQPPNDNQFITLTNEEMKGECCNPVDPWMICLRSNCTSFMHNVEGPPFSSTPANPEWAVVTQNPRWGENSTWVLEQITKTTEFKEGVACACNHCYDGPNMLSTIWPASKGVCAVLRGTNNNGMHDGTTHGGSASSPAWSNPIAPAPSSTMMMRL